MINEKRLTDFFEELCKINSPSKNEKEIIEYLKNFYTDLGFECWEDHAAKETGGNANNLYGCLKGNPNKKSVCFNAHTDTVMPTENINIINDGKIIKTDGTTILGADDKAGISCATEAVRSIIEQDEDHGDIYILFTVQEEIGVGGANCVTNKNFSPDITFSFDTGKPVLCMVASAPTHYRMKYTIKGKASHAAYPQGSINAVKCACNAIAKLETGMIDEETCCNFGSIKGGERTNIVPDICEILAEARSQNSEKAKKLTDRITKTFEEECKIQGAVLEKDIKCEYEAFRIDEKDPDFMTAYETAKTFVKEPFIEHSLGGYDASIFNAKGLKTIVCGIGYENIHSVSEYIEINDLITSAQFCYQLIKKY